MAAVLSVRKVVVREVAPAILTVPEVGNDFAITSATPLEPLALEFRALLAIL